MPAKQRQDWIWDKIIYANPIKAVKTLEHLDKYKPLVTYDNSEEIAKIKMPDLNCFTVEAPMNSVKGTARSMGVDVDAKV